MAVFACAEAGPPSAGDRYRLDTGGAESNVAIGVRRLGVPSVWIGRVGDDAYGRMIVRELRAESVDVSGAVVDSSAPTGIMFSYPRTADLYAVEYRRTASAGSRLCPDDLLPDLIAGAACVHVSGITLGISASARAAALEALRVARAHGVTTSFSVNHRALGWTPETAVEVYRSTLPLVDVLFASAIEAELIVGGAGPTEACELLARLGPREAIVTNGADGAVAHIDGYTHIAAGNAVTVVDTTGAGDAFVAGYLVARITGDKPLARLNVANRVAAVTAATSGNWRGTPSRRELDELTNTRDTHSR